MEEEKKKPGRKRCEDTTTNIMTAALKLVEQSGFSDLTIEGVAAEAGVGKATIYRWWNNKAALVMEAFLKLRQSQISFRDSGHFRADLRDQTHRFVRFMNGTDGRTLAGLLGGAQSDPELAEALLRDWLNPRRQEATAFFHQAMERGQLKSQDTVKLLDAIYGPLYYRLMVAHAPVTTEFADYITDLVLATAAAVVPG